MVAFARGGLRFHRSMREDDVYDGPLDLARFGQAVVGPLSDDQKWLVNPLSYDPTRPSGVASADASAEQVSMATPTHEPATLGSYAALPTDIEVSLLAELGQAVTRGAELVSHGQQSPTAEPAHDAHAALPVPLTAPHTPETAVASPFGAPNSSSFRSSSRQPAGTGHGAAARSGSGATVGEELAGPTSTLYLRLLYTAVGLAQLCDREVVHQKGGHFPRLPPLPW